MCWDLLMLYSIMTTKTTRTPIDFIDSFLQLGDDFGHTRRSKWWVRGAVTSDGAIYCTACQVVQIKLLPPFQAFKMKLQAAIVQHPPETPLCCE